MTAQVIALPIKPRPAIACVDTPAELYDMLAYRAARSAASGTADDLLALAALIERRVAEVRAMIEEPGHGA